MLSINYIDDEDTGYICGANDNQDLLCQLKQIIEHNYIKVDKPKEPVIKTRYRLVELRGGLSVRKKKNCKNFGTIFANQLSILLL